MTDDLERPVTPFDGWRVLLPPGWVTLPTEREACRKAVAALIDWVFEGKPRDELIQARIELDRGLRKQAAQAAKAGAQYVHSLTRMIKGLPVSASMIAVPVATGDPEELAMTLGSVLGDADGVVENGHTELGNGTPALRRVRREVITLGGADGTQVQGTFVDYVVPVSNESILVMTFSTTTELVHQELVVLFDAIASTLRSVETS